MPQQDTYLIPLNSSSDLCTHLLKEDDHCIDNTRLMITWLKNWIYKPKVLMATKELDSI